MISVWNNPLSIRQSVGKPVSGLGKKRYSDSLLLPEMMALYWQSQEPPRILGKKYSNHSVRKKKAKKHQSRREIGPCHSLGIVFGNKDSQNLCQKIRAHRKFTTGISGYLLPGTSTIVPSSSLEPEASKLAAAACSCPIWLQFAFFVMISHLRMIRLESRESHRLGIRRNI